METAGKLESDGGFESGPRNWEWGGAFGPLKPILLRVKSAWAHNLKAH